MKLSDQARNFLRESIRRDRHRRGRAVAILSVLLVGALTLALFAYDSQRSAVAQTRIATARQFASTAEAEVGQHLDQSMLLSAKAYRLNPEPRTYAAAFRSATASPELAAFAYTKSPISAVAALSDDESVLVGEDDGTVASWSTRTQKWLRYGRLSHSIVSLAGSDHGSAIVATDGYQVAVLRPASAPRVLTTDTENDLTAVALSPDGNTVFYARSLYSESRGTITKQEVSAATSMTVSLGSYGPDRLVVGTSDVFAFDGSGGYWARLSLPDLLVEASLHPGFGTHDYASAMSDDGGAFSYTNSAPSIPVWDSDATHDGPNSSEWDASPTRWGRGPGVSPEAMALSPKGKYLGISDAGTIYVSEPNADANATPIQWRLAGVSDVGVRTLQFLGDDRLVSTGQRQLALWDFRQVSPLTQFQWADVPSSCAACSGPFPVLSPDGRWAAYLAAGAGGVGVHDFSTGKDSWYTKSFGPPSWSPDSRYLLVPNNSRGSVDVVASGTLTRVRTWPSDGLRDDVVAARYLDGNATFATATATGRVTIRNATTGKVLKTTAPLHLQLQASPDLRHVAINGQGTRLTLISADSGVYTVDLTNGKATRLADAAASGITVQYAGSTLLVSADSYASRTSWINIYSGGDGTTLLHHVDTGFGMLEGGVASEGQLVAYQGRDGSVAFVDKADGTLVGTFPMRASVEGLHTGLAFDATGDHLVTVTEGDDTDASFIEKWSVAPNAVIRTLCRIAGRRLTKTEWQTFAGSQRPDLTCR